MAPEEAIEIIKYYYPKRKGFTCGIRIDVDDTECTFGRALTAAMQALKEIQQYREIGTVNELKYFKDMKTNLKKYHVNISVSRLLEYFIETVFENTRHEGFIILTNQEAKDYEAYCSIGTVEECKEARKSRWILVEERLPEYEERCRNDDSCNRYLKRLEIAYMTDIVEYTHGYYDGYKWIDKKHDIIPNAVAWRVHEPYRPGKDGE